MSAAQRHAEAARITSNANDVWRQGTYQWAAERAWRAQMRSKVRSFVARKAIEQKLVVDLEQETGTEPYVIAPKSWANEILGGYETGNPTASDTWREGTLGYVQKLQDYVYAYPFLYPFQGGEDWAVVSMKEDYVQAGADCYDRSWFAGANFLPWAESFTSWTVIDCTLAHDDAVVTPRGATGAQKLTLATNATAGSVTSPWVSIPNATGMTEDTAVQQLTASVFVQPLGSGTTVTLTLCRADASHCTEMPPHTLSAANPWLQVSDTFSYLGSGEARGTLGTVLPFTLSIRVSGNAHIWGAQLETGGSASGLNPTAAVAPARLRTAFCAAVDTSAAGAVLTARPIRHEAKLFRDAIGLKCVTSAATRPGDYDCEGEGGVEYYELPFIFTLNDVESGKIIKEGQIAVNNYNYRIADIGVNLVGSNIKDCTREPLSTQSCYANLYVPYSLTQQGQVQVRDHNRREHEFSMPTAHIQYAKGLAAERYLTIPLSGTDLGLVTPYLKSELRGRPLEGAYTLRVHNTPSLAWENLEDIQLLIHYRYWTAFGQ
jgi:hypothetical protein